MPTTSPDLRFIPGQLVSVGPRASVQFAGDRALAFRVIRLLDWSTADGWAWLEGYVLNHTGNAVSRRVIYVQPEGLTVLSGHPPARG